MESQSEFLNPREPLSYLQARDPSILSFNRHGLRGQKLDFAEFSEETRSVEQDGQVKVFLRIKGRIAYQETYTLQDNTISCKIYDGPSTSSVKEPINMTKKFVFSKILGPAVTQTELFDEIIKPKMLDFINGSNSTLMAYGTSGAGKTFTMVGTKDQPGIIPRSLNYLFRTLPLVNDEPLMKPTPQGSATILSDTERKKEKMNSTALLQTLHGEHHGEHLNHIKTFNSMQDRLSDMPVARASGTPDVVSVWISFAEIYNEKIYDLLTSTAPQGGKRPILKLAGIPGQYYIKGLTYCHVKSGVEAYHLLKHGQQNLSYAATGINTNSSRSHCIFTVRLLQGLKNDPERATVSCLNFCDLAGFERAKKTCNIGDRLKESKNINTSLLVLGRCLRKIRDNQFNKENSMPPFRESKLTQLFQRAFCGHENISVIVNINPSPDMMEETMQALNFSAVAKEIIQQHDEPKQMCKARVAGPEGHITQENTEEELRYWRNLAANVTLELSETRQKCKEMLEKERHHLTSTYNGIITLKDQMYETLKRKYDNLLAENREEVISISDSDDEEVADLRLEVENLKGEVELKSHDYELKLEEYKAEISRLQAEVYNLREDLEERERELDDVLVVNTSLREENESSH